MTLFAVAVCLLFLLLQCNSFSLIGHNTITSVPSVRQSIDVCEQQSVCNNRNYNNRQVSGRSSHYFSLAMAGKPTDGPSARGPRPPKKLKDDVIQVNGIVTDSLPNAMFRVDVEMGPSKSSVLCTISGKIRKNFVRIIVGDSVVAELSAYDLTRGRITFRNK